MDFAAARRNMVDRQLRTNKVMDEAILKALGEVPRERDVPAELRAAAAALVDVGELPGTPSTVVDLTGEEPRVLREGAVPAAEALRLVASVL